MTSSSSRELAPTTGAKLEAEPSAASEANAIVALIERAVTNPAVDVDKMERLLAMQERVLDRHARTAYSAALAEMQPKLPVITERGRIVVPAKDGKPGHETPYAKWEDINEAIRPLLAAHGFALSFRVGLAADGKIEVTGVLSHREGHQVETTITLMHDSSGSKNAVQAVGSSTSYGKRYTAMALLNITTRGEDDDGGAGDPRESGAVQATNAAINACADLAALKAWKAKNADNLQRMPTADADAIVRCWNDRAARLKAPAQ